MVKVVVTKIRYMYYSNLCTSDSTACTNQNKYNKFVMSLFTNFDNSFDGRQLRIYIYVCVCKCLPSYCKKSEKNPTYQIFKNNL